MKNDIFFKRSLNDRKHEDLYRVKKTRNKDDLKTLRELYKTSKKSNKRQSQNKGISGSGGGGFWYFDNPYTKFQRVALKVSYSTKMSAHNQYLNKYITQLEKEEVHEKPELFGTSDDDYDKVKCNKHFKIMISPESQNINLEAMAESFIMRINYLTGYNLAWKAAIHKDKDHKHFHICVNGLDLDGKEVFFKKELIKSIMRETCSHIATSLVGQRTQSEIQAALKNIPKSNRWTVLDEGLEKYGNKINTKFLSTEQNERLAYLHKIGLANKTGNNFELLDTWKDVLIATGRYNTFYDEWNKRKGNIELYRGGILTGKVEKVISFDKDESWNDAIIVRSNDKSVYIPVYQLKKDELIGKEISIISPAQGKELSQVKDSDIKIMDSYRKKDNQNRITF